MGRPDQDRGRGHREQATVRRTSSGGDPTTPRPPYGRRMTSSPPAPVPVVDLSAPDAGAALVAALGSHASALLVGHGVDPALRRRMIELSRAFFALPVEEKAE